MQLSARILTALAVLAFTVAIVAGARSATEEVRAATGTIDALNVGVCTTTNADVFDIDNCTQTGAFFQQVPLEDLIEVESLYATYAHDPKTGAESPRAILTDGDLLKISITDKGRDRRDPVLITAPFGTFAADEDPVAVDAVNNNEKSLKADADAATPQPNARAVIGDALNLSADPAEEGGVTYPDLPDLEQEVDYAESTAIARDTDAVFANSGTYEALWGRPDDDETAFKPIAPDGVVKFFGRVNPGTPATEFGPFEELDGYIVLDEDVLSGDVNTPPVMTLNISVPDAQGAMVDLQVIYYETSGVEYIQGGDKCFPDPDDTADDTSATAPEDVNEMYRALAQAACTSDEISDGDSFTLHAESDEDAADTMKHLALQETGRFTGVFQGELRLTDADGPGNGTRINWGREKRNGVYTEKRGDAEGQGESYVGAVLGVGDGPVVITYVDTDGNKKTYDIQIDIEPPAIIIDSPAHEGRSDDEKPSFIGTFNDADSGLAADSFQLDVDNRNDLGDLKPVIMVGSGVGGPGESPGNEYAQVRRRLDYSGYGVTETYGVIAVQGDIYKKAGTPIEGDVAEHYSVEADDFEHGAPDGEFNDEQEIDFDEVIPSADFLGFNNAVDFQALVRDLAGNVGFSDSDAVNPRFIDDLGADDADGTDKDANRKKGPGKHNVLGVFSRHVVYIDERDPVIITDASVTGFYGLNDDDKLIRDRSAVMVVFDNSVNGELIDTGTFALEHDEDTAIEIADVSVDGKLVFLKLGEELASDATPTLSIAEGREVEDLAGNLLTWQEEDAEAFEVNDGIQPVFTLTLSGGSGSGVGSESPSKLTNAAMDISIDSDEDVNGSPKVAVVCSNIQWTVGEDKFDVDDYVGNRTGVEEDDNKDGLTCGGNTEGEGATDFRSASSLSRPGNNWVYAWRNASTDPRKLQDGKLVIVVWGRDRSKYDAHASDVCPSDDCENWGSETTTFTLDSIFNSPLNKDGSGGSVQPEAKSKVKEPRPFVYLDFAGEMTSVTVTELTVDGEDVIGDLSSVGDNRFLYWPEALDFGTHKVAFDARDAADNGPLGSTSFEFDVTARDPFVIDLTAGWNAISFPANPIDTALEAVFTEEAVDRVVGWNPLSSTGPWSIATRIDGVWTTSANFAPLTDVVVRYGYWVHSLAFVEQSVDLQGQLNRETGASPDPIGIITVPGWNFVGVVDQDGDQTEDNFGDTLQRKEADLDEPTPVTADDYMPGFRQAYIWDAIANGYRVLGGGDDMEIGKGIWVFFPDDDTIAP